MYTLLLGLTLVFSRYVTHCIAVRVTPAILIIGTHVFGKVIFYHPDVVLICTLTCIDS